MSLLPTILIYVDVIISNVKEIWFWNSYLPTFLHDVIKYPVFFWMASLTLNIYFLVFSIQNDSLVHVQYSIYNTLFYRLSVDEETADNNKQVYSTNKL